MFWMSEEKRLERSMTDEVISSAFEVWRALGSGLPAGAYREAMQLELESRRVAVTYGTRLVVKYRSQIVGEFAADLLVEQRLMVKVESAPQLTPASAWSAQQLLTAARLERGLVMNFGAPRLEYRRLHAR